MSYGIRNSAMGFFALALLAGLSQVASADTWNIDTDHASVHFKIKHMMLSNVNGDLSGVKGTFDIDDKDMAKSKVEASVPIATINTSNAKRDGHLKSPDFFDAAKYPTMTFKSTKFESAGEGKWKIVGKLTLHGVTRDVTWNVDDLSSPVNDPFGNRRRGFSASTKINRKDFGLKWNKALETGGVMVGEEVAVTVDAEMIQPGKAKKS